LFVISSTAAGHVETHTYPNNYNSKAMSREVEGGWRGIPVESSADIMMPLSKKNVDGDWDMSMGLWPGRRE
jgi:hypothetical protein